MADLSLEAKEAIRSYLKKRVITIASFLGIGNAIAIMAAWHQVQSSTANVAVNAATDAIRDKLQNDQVVKQATDHAITRSLAQIRDLGEIHGRVQALTRTLTQIDTRVLELSSQFDGSIQNANERLDKISSAIDAKEDDPRVKLLNEAKLFAETNPGVSNLFTEVRPQIKELQEQVHKLTSSLPSAGEGFLVINGVLLCWGTTTSVEDISGNIPGIAQSHSYKQFSLMFPSAFATEPSVAVTVDCDSSKRVAFTPQDITAQTDVLSGRILQSGTDIISDAITIHYIAIGKPKVEHQ